MKLQENTFDAIVVGSGITGGWAAKELCEKGLKTIVLERGRNVEHPAGYTTTNMDPWEHKHRGIDTVVDKENSPVQSKCYAFTEASKQFFVNDKEHPYEVEDGKHFAWIRGYHVGGRSLLWARQCYRWSDLDFEANAKDGHGIDWPIRYKEIAPWYDYAEKFAGISGQAEGLNHLPDGQFLPPMEMNCVEKHVRKVLKEKFERTLTIGRCAHLTTAKEGRGPCQFRNNCYTGCPFGGYFSSNSATLPAAAKTGNLTLRPFSVAHSIIYDEEQGKAVGVRIIDSETLEEKEYYAKVIFLCASTLGSTQLLMQSKNNRFPDGIGAESGALGHYLMDHIFESGANGEFEGWEDQYYNGHRPNGIYIARFRNVDSVYPDFLRGYGYQGSASRKGWQRGGSENGFGSEFKESLTHPGQWVMSLGGFGEMLPNYNNKIELSNKVDKWGIPLLKISASFGENETKMRADMAVTAAEMLEASGAKNVNTYTLPESESPTGYGIHEMGTARMGKDPKDSVLNKWNQVWDAPNIFVTDGSAMASSACQNPSITYMALTARAVNYAVEELKKQNL